jgi:hypothetical protein
MDICLHKNARITPAKLTHTLRPQPVVSSRLAAPSQ